MKKPKDLDNYPQCVCQYDKTTWIFCTECNNWRRVAISCKADVFFSPGLVLAKVSNCYDLSYLCGHCKADIGYLLSDEHRDKLIKSMDIPTGDVE